MFGKPKPKETHIRSALESVAGCSVQNIMIDGGKVRAILACHAADAPRVEIEAEQALKGLKGIHEAQVIITAEREASAPARAANTEKIYVDAKHIIAVASGKGGVGKSTVAMNLACGLAASGQKVGLLDADIYGPSVPRMTGLSGQKPAQNSEGKIVPLVKKYPSLRGIPGLNGDDEAIHTESPDALHGLLRPVGPRNDEYKIHVISIGFMIGEDNPLIWRGPMVQSAFTQLLQDVAWEGLDTLVIDLPPGTGDVQLTMAQRVPLTGAVIVSTPQDIALIDVRKGIEMFKKVNVPILGLIENMSYHICEKCGHEDHVFGSGGAKEEAEKLGIPFLGAIPLNASIRRQADAGEPSPEFYEGVIDNLL